MGGDETGATHVSDQAFLILTALDGWAADDMTTFIRGKNGRESGRAYRAISVPFPMREQGGEI